MPQARDEAGNIWEVDAQGNPVRLISAGQILPDPTAPYEAPAAAADLARTQTQTRIEAAKAPAEIRKAEADAAKAAAEAQETLTEARLWENTQERRSIREAFKTDAILRALRNARKIAQEDGGTGWESLLSGVPSTDAKRLQTELSPIMGNLAFDRLQQMRDESKTGAAVGSVTERELDLLASTVASLDTAVDLPTFLDRLDAIERHFIGMQLNALGVDPNSDEGRAAFKSEYGYTGVFDGETPEGNAGLADPNATTASGNLPPEYQQAHLRYLRDNWGNITPEGYVKFRSALDEAFGQTPDLNAYANAVPSFNQLAQQGGSPEQLGAVPAANRSLGTIEQVINQAAQSGAGAFLANSGNAMAMGIPARLGGNQDQLELLREARPVSSFAGEIIGGGLGAAAMPLAGPIAGGGRLAAMLRKPLSGEMFHSGVYGATQDDNMLRGAVTGAGGALAGSILGRQIGKAFPETYAGGAVRQADDAVPTVSQLKERASDLYADVTAQGVEAGADETAEMLDRANKVLASNGRVGGDGRVIIPDGSTKQAYDLISSYAGGTMTPVQAQTVRETLGEGLTSNVPKERRIASMLLEEFDNWSQPVMPGAEQAREVSSRYIRGQQLQDLSGLGQRRGERLKGNDVADSTRTLFGQLDEKVAKGQAFFDQPTKDAISRVAQGDKTTNTLRAAGKYGFGSVLPTTGIGATGVNTAFLDGNPALMGIPLAIGAGGTLARRLASNRTIRAAQEAELTALGGPEYLEALEAARQMAAANAGRFYGGLFGAGASASTR